MRAHRMKMEIPDDRVLRLEVPQDIPAGTEVDIVILVHSGEAQKGPKLSLEEFCERRLVPPPGVHLTLEDIDEAIAEGAVRSTLGRGNQ